jgi:RNA methyltransferase, TrmH family
VSFPPPAGPPIASTANPRIKAVVRLRDRRERDTSGLTVIDGIREIDRALDAGVDIVEAFAADELIRTPAARALRDRLEAGALPVTEVSAVVLERLAFGDRIDGLVAIARMPRRSLADVRLDERPGDAAPLVAVVEGVEKPGNLGAILRSADGAGLDAVIVADPRTDLANPNVIRASLGTVFSRPVVAATTTDTVDWLVRRGLAIVAARVDASVTYTDADLTRPLAIVLGAEAEGLTDAWTGSRIEPVRVPMLGAADSLSLSAAAAILFYEALRQRSAARPGKPAAPFARP